MRQKRNAVLSHSVGMVFDEALNKGNSRFIKRLLALKMRRTQQQGKRGGQGTREQCLLLREGLRLLPEAPYPHLMGHRRHLLTRAAVSPGLAPDPLLSTCFLLKRLPAPSHHFRSGPSHSQTLIVWPKAGMHNARPLSRFLRYTTKTYIAMSVDA